MLSLYLNKTNALDLKKKKKKILAILVFYQEKSSQINEYGLFIKAIKMYGSLLVYGTEREYACSL